MFCECRIIVLRNVWSWSVALSVRLGNRNNRSLDACVACPCKLAVIRYAGMQASNDAWSDAGSLPDRLPPTSRSASYCYGLYTRQILCWPTKRNETSVGVGRFLGEVVSETSVNLMRRAAQSFVCRWFCVKIRHFCRCIKCRTRGYKVSRVRWP